MLRSSLLVLVAAAAPLCACRPADPPTGVAASGRAALDVRALDDGLVDVADRECRVVLRQADHVTGARDQGVAVLIDVAAPLLADPGATPGLVARADGGDWQTLAASATDGAPAGFARFVARLAFANDAEFIALATTTSAVRLFDHNRLPGDFDNFHVDASNGWTVAAAPALCPGRPPEGHLVFAAGYTQTQLTPLVTGGLLVVDYDLDRLRSCRATHDGYRFWTLDASARFSPGGQLASGSVVASNGPAVFATPFTTAIPADATAVALWFRNASPPDCEAWDSDYGRNYVFPVAGK
jgi:hypothetical protein